LREVEVFHIETETVVQIAKTQSQIRFRRLGVDVRCRKLARERNRLPVNFLLRSRFRRATQPTLPLFDLTPGENRSCACSDRLCPRPHRGDR
jgi:hypothetical protein